MTLVALKVAHFPDDSSPDGMDICQWGREGLEAFLLGGESHMGSRARDTLNAALVPTSQLWKEANFGLSPPLSASTKSLKSGSWLASWDVGFRVHWNSAWGI